MLDSDNGGTLLCQTLLSTLTHVAVTQTTGLHLVSEVLGAGLLSLGLVDVLHQDTLVLEDVTLALEVELVVAVVIGTARTHQYNAWDIIVTGENRGESTHSKQQR